MAKKYCFYVWRNVLTDYTSGIIAAAASSAEEAREAVRKAANDNGYVFGETAAEPEVLDLPAAVYCWGGS